MANQNMAFDYNKQPGLKRKIITYQGYDKPSISIITPYYNAKKYFEQTAISVLNQTFPFWEWIIINDGSDEPNVEKFIKKVVNNDKRVRVINTKNGGPAEARMLGVKEAKAEYVFLLDTDDLIDETMLECSYWCLETNPSASWAYSNIIGFGLEQYLWSVPFDIRLEKKENILCVSSLIRKSILNDFNYNDIKIKDFHEDWVLWLNLLAKGYVPAQMNFYGFWYRRLKGRMFKVDTNLESKKASDALTKKYAKKVKNNIKGLLFPNVKTKDYTLKYYDWNKNKIIKYETEPILILANDIDLKALKKLNPNKEKMFLITTKAIDINIRQKLIEYAFVYDLSSFLSLDDWLGFIDYTIKSKKINRVYYKEDDFFSKVIKLLKNKYKKLLIENLETKKLFNYSTIDNIDLENEYITYLKQNVIREKSNIESFLYRFGYKMWKYRFYRNLIKSLKKVKEVVYNGFKQKNIGRKN